MNAGCHDGSNLLPPSCTACHPAQWKGSGLPPDHSDTTNSRPDRRAQLMGGFAWHRYGWGSPYSVYNRSPYSPDGCTRCHGPNLNNGFAPSCFSCHGANGQGPPADHIIPKGTPAEMHKAGYEDPYTNCTTCHGQNLNNGYAISCFSCHGAADHTIPMGGGPNPAMHKEGYDNPTANCTGCHGATFQGGLGPSCNSCHGAGGGPPGNHDQPKGNPPAMHKPGHQDPYANCTSCHGTNLNNGFATSCFSCHGASGDHTVLLGGVIGHKPGYEDPFGSGCASCHGEDLTGGFGPSCYNCHGARWDPHNFAGEPWLPAGENHCHVCHLSPAFNGNSAPEWNHRESTSLYTTIFGTGVQLNGKSDKCMDCHEGNIPVDAFGSNAGGSYYVRGEEAFGTDLRHHHAVSFPFTLSGTGLNDPATTPSGLTRRGTIAEDMLESGQVECTTCHNQHDNRNGNYLVETAGEGLCFICHKMENFVEHHIPDRGHPWASFRCTMCHGADLRGSAGVPGCTDCHNEFAPPDAPAPGHHGNRRLLPYFDCAACHADPLTGMLTGNDFGTLHAPSCYQCHEDLWNRNGNAPPVMVAIGPLTGKAGQAVTFDASAIRDPEGDPVAYEWSFGDGSPAQLPSHNPKTAHTYGEIGTYTATLAVTDGVNAPQHVQITVTIGAAAPTPVADRWNVTTTEPSSFTITFETHSGSLVGIRDGRVLSLGIEYSGVIFWMELWMDASGNAYWGTGDMYFGNINRRRGTMSGVMFDEAGGVLMFSGAKN